MFSLLFIVILFLFWYFMVKGPIRKCVNYIQTAKSITQEKKRKENLLLDYGDLPVDEIITGLDLSRDDKAHILYTKYNRDEVNDLLDTAEKEGRKAKLKPIKRKIIQNIQESYGNIPTDSREPIPDDVKDIVWRRDAGKCVKCGSQEKLEFDHIIPVSKGGSNTARNIQILCEKCNRSKSDHI
jgi:hypothetical protein